MAAAGVYLLHGQAFWPQGRVHGIREHNLHHDGDRTCCDQSRNDSCWDLLFPREYVHLHVWASGQVTWEVTPFAEILFGGSNTNAYTGLVKSINLGGEPSARPGLSTPSQWHTAGVGCECVSQGPRFGR